MSRKMLVDKESLFLGKDWQTEMTRNYSNLFNVHDYIIEETQRNVTAWQEDWLKAREPAETVDISSGTVSKASKKV